ncbi:type II toxin-antitoxin system VapB family antitoxin [Embleya sp. NPDC005575]|uniref:type II toxin-antitoxin system VapB family antitoxin n=1 Tax=Embleya sp. NPDC005575 TaxID=3156892 RepID=UPI0033BED521
MEQRTSATRTDLDDEALAEAKRLMGTTTEKETVNTALRDHVARGKRLEALDNPVERGMRGEFDRAAEAHAAAKKTRQAAFEWSDSSTLPRFGRMWWLRESP